MKKMKCVNGGCSKIPEGLVIKFDFTYFNLSTVACFLKA